MDQAGSEQLSDPQALSQADPAPPSTLVIFGAGGDLTKRLLMPSLYNLAIAKLLTDSFSVVGVDRVEMDDDAYRAKQTETMHSFVTDRGGEFSTSKLDEDAWGWVKQRLFYLSGDFQNPETFAKIAAKIDGLGGERGHANCVFYLAVADRFFGTIVERLAAAGLMREDGGRFRRVVIEKPFGHDLASARALNQQILGLLSERQIYRIDHFLGKETVQNIMALRFSNGIFEPLWRRDHIDHVQITAAETVGVELRGKFYEATGALRDMVPNHMFQLMAMVAMEAPNSFDADAVRAEKAKVIEAIHPLSHAEVLTDVVRGQYGAGRVRDADVRAYNTEPDVDPHSRTETYAAMKFRVDNWRWAGVPFYIRTGKRMAVRRTEIAIHFKQAPYALFRDTPVERLTPNILTLHIQPSEGASLQFSAKVPGPVVHLGPVTMDFNYGDYFKTGPTTGYETLLYDVLIGDATLFQRADNVDAGWAAVQPILDCWAAGEGDVHPYPAGGPGPAEADTLLALDGRHWLKLP